MACRDERTLLQLAACLSSAQQLPNQQLALLGPVVYRLYQLPL